MSSIATKRFIAIFLLALSGVVNASGQSSSPPRHITDPVLGIRLPLKSANLDTLPEQVRANCEQIADNPTWTGHQWIFGTTQEGPTTYYLVGGYFKRRHVARGQEPYFLPEQGGVYEVAGQRCGGDPAREVFSVRDVERIPQAVLQRLAQDLASRLIRTLGGPDRLRDEMNKQRIDVDGLSPELREAFAPYLKRVAR